jgi:hypothetical protein
MEDEMENHRTLATWDHEGTSYCVSVRLENGEPKEVVFEQVTDGGVRCTSLTAGGASLAELEDAWSTRRRHSVMSFRVRQVLDIAAGLQDSQHRTD